MERYLQATVPAARARVSEPAARSRAAFGGPPGLSITRSWLDPLISSRKVALVDWGHNPKSQRWEYVGIEHKTRPELAAEILQMVSEWFPDRTFHVLGDSAYGGKSILKPLPKGFHVTSRLPIPSGPRGAEKSSGSSQRPCGFRRRGA